MNVISFSVYGKDEKYIVGMQRNIELAFRVYPSWDVWIYYGHTIDNFKYIFECDGVRLIDMEDSQLPGMFWRFLPSVDRFIVRDADSRLSYREKAAVNDWIDSGKTLHIMRDHPHHKQTIMGGMWGIRLGGGSIKDDVNKWCINDESWGSVHYSNADQRFLRDVIYPRYAKDTIAHDSIGCKYPNSVPFPTDMVDRRFVGEIYDEHDNRGPQYKLLKK